MTPCPCCYHPTLLAHNARERCRRCGWIDDGQDDLDAHVARGGPNPGTLWQARARALASRSSDEAGGPPAVDAPWRLVDGAALEWVPASDLTVWRVFHDASVIGVARHHDRVSLTFDAAYLRERFAEPGRGFVLELFECDELVYAPYDDEELTDLDAIAQAEPNVLDMARVGDQVEASGSYGVLRARYVAHALRFDSGAPLAIAALVREASRYWDAWAARAPR